METSDTEYTRVLRSQRASDASGWYNAAAAITDQYWYESANYNPNNLGGLEAAVASFISTTETELTQFNTTKQLAASDQTYSAVIQAAGAVNISTQNNFDNSVVRAGYNYIGSGPRTNTDTPGTAFSTRVTLNQQLPPDLAQQQVNPLALPGFSLPTGQNGLFRLSGQDVSTADGGTQNWSLSGGSVNTAQHQSQSGSTTQNLVRVQGVPTSAVSSQPQKYLIETNPVLTDLKQFMSSDYLLAGLGYDPDESAKRLGDGLYEQRLVQQAITARTGQAFIDGQTSNEDQFKYLMNNAIASKDALDLTVGVSLTSEQVAALTHDIVWMEDAVVDGQHVLVPVLYLAQADNRLAPNGALIQGSDITLIAGKDLNNAGTLKATNNLAAMAGNNLVNSGLVEAGNRLDLLAGGDLTNKAGGILAGRDVSLTAINGDVTNERTVTTHDSSSGYYTQQRQFADSAARVEAANNLTIQAGRDINNTGGVLQAGNDIGLTAGRDVNITSAQVLNSDAHGIDNNSKTIVQNGSTVTAGHDLTVQAGRDVTAVASQLDAKNDISIAAKGDLTLTSAADEEHSYGKTKKVTSQEDHVSQVSTVLTAGGSVALSAGKDLNLVASQVSAKDEAYLYAGGDVNLLAAQDSDYSYYSKTKKGSWGKKSSKMSESDSDVAVGSVIQVGGDTHVVAANDVNVQGSMVNSDKGTLSVLAGHDVNLTAAQNTIHSATASSSSGGLGLSSTGKSNTDSSTQTSLSGSTLSGNTTLVQAGHDLMVSASDVISTEQTTLRASNNININSGIESFSAEHSQSKSKSGLMGTGGIGVTLGTAKNRYTQNTDNKTQRGSTVGSVLGNVNITAGKDLGVIASDLVAGNDINLIGQNVSISDASDDSTTSRAEKSKSSGLTLALSGVVGSAVNTAVQTAQEVKHEDDTRLAALQGVKAGLSGYQAWQGAQAIESGAEAGSFFGISLSLGTQSSSSKQSQQQSISQGSSITAANDLNIIATGSGLGSDDGDITIVGSKFQAGNDMLLSANRDIDLRAGANTQLQEGSNKSGGGAVGLSLGVGSGGGGLSIFASGNSGAGQDKGSGTTWTETTLDAGNNLTLQSGRDTSLVGAQANAQKIIADVGRDLTLTSLQDTDRYNAKQTNVSGGLSFTFGTMTASGSLSVSQDKIKSNFDSVQEQTGLFAGQGGYQVQVGKHTQLNGSVIASTAEATQNKLSTGTLGWADIDNNAEFSSQHQSVSVSSSGSVGQQFLGNMGSALLVGSNHNGSDSSTTYSAISNGMLTVRDPINQVQDISTISHDVEHANNALSPIFDKEKEQNRLRQAQMIGDIGNQAMDIIRTQGMIEASKAAVATLTDEQNNMPGASVNASEKDRAAYIKLLQDTDAYKNVMAGYGTGSGLQQAAQAVTAAIQGLAGGNIGQALVGASAPYVAETIKKMTEGNEEARIMAHAVLGAVTASVQGANAAAGAAGAAVAATSTETIMRELYGTTDVKALTESQKQTVSALVTLASGLAGAAIGGDGSSALAAAQAGKNTAENNDEFYIVPVDPGYGQASTTMSQDLLLNHGASAGELSDAQHALAEGQGFDGLQPGTSFVQAWTTFMLARFGVVPSAVGLEAAAAGGAVSGAINSSYQLSEDEPFSYTDATMATLVGALTQGRGFWSTMAISVDGGYIGAKLKGENTAGAAIATAMGTAAGFAGGKVVADQLKPVIGEAASETAGATVGGAVSELVGDKLQGALEGGK